jgi:hypothetical protein
VLEIFSQRCCWMFSKSHHLIFQILTFMFVTGFLNVGSLIEVLLTSLVIPTLWQMLPNSLEALQVVLDHVSLYLKSIDLMTSVRHGTRRDSAATD